MNRRRRFHFFGDPICLASMIIYAVNRWYLKPHHIGGAFTQGYVNDLLCLPLFLPVILGVQRVIRLRKHDAPPRMWEVVQHAIIFSLLFEVILPRYPRQFHTTADPWDAVAYLVGGVAAWISWRLLKNHQLTAWPIKKPSEARFTSVVFQMRIAAFTFHLSRMVSRHKTCNNSAI